MAQPAVPVSGDRTDFLGFPVFWHKPTADPPSSWDSGIGQFNLAITLRAILPITQTLILPSRKLDHLGRWWARFSSRTLMRRQNFGDRIFTRSINMFFPASAERKVIRFSLPSKRRLFSIKKMGGESLFIFRTKLGLKFGN